MPVSRRVDGAEKMMGMLAEKQHGRWGGGKDRRQQSVLFLRKKNNRRESQIRREEKGQR